MIATMSSYEEVHAEEGADRLGGGESGVSRVGARDGAEQLGVVRGEALRASERASE